MSLNDFALLEIVSAPPDDQVNRTQAHPVASTPGIPSHAALEVLPLSMCGRLKLAGADEVIESHRGDLDNPCTSTKSTTGMR